METGKRRPMGGLMKMQGSKRSGGMRRTGRRTKTATTEVRTDKLTWFERTLESTRGVDPMTEQVPEKKPPTVGDPDEGGWRRDDGPEGSGPGFCLSGVTTSGRHQERGSCSGKLTRPAVLSNRCFGGDSCNCSLNFQACHRGDI